MSLLKKDTIKKRWVNKSQQKLDGGNKKKYEVEVT